MRGPSTVPRWYRPAIIVAVVVAFGLRVAWGLWAAREPTQLVDPARYLGYARMIADGKGFTEPLTGQATAYYPPGYPWFVGVVAWVTRALPFSRGIGLSYWAGDGSGGSLIVRSLDSTPQAVALAQAAIGAATAGLGAAVVRRLAGPVAAVAAAATLALYPNLVFHSGTVLSETLYNGLFIGFLAILVLGPRTRPSTRRLAIAGGVLGLAVLVRPISLAVLPVVALWLWSLPDEVETDEADETEETIEAAETVDVRSDDRPTAAHPTRRRLLIPTAVLVAAVVGVLVPWTIRNQVRMHEFVALSTNTGDNLCIGHHPGANGAFTTTSACDTERSFFEGPAGEVAHDAEARAKGIRYFRENLGREPWLVWRRFYFMFVRDGDHDGLVAAQSYKFDPWMAPATERRLARLADLTYWLVDAVAVVGLVLAIRRRDRGVLLVVGLALATAVVPLAFFGDARFKVPVIPLLVLVAATVLGGRAAGAPTGEREPMRAGSETAGRTA